MAVALISAPWSKAVAASYPTSSAADDSVSFSVAVKTAVPGTTLKPGTYAIRVVDHLADRVILSIQDPKGKTLTTFLGLPNAAIRRPAYTGAINWPNGPHKQTAVRGFSFPGGSAVEFVYPKADAVEIAKVNTSKVAAIDPASEGHSGNSKKLSPDDLQLLTLWSLSSTRVGPENASQPAIAAERYQPVQEARNVAPPAPGMGTNAQRNVSSGTEMATSGSRVSMNERQPAPREQRRPPVTRRPPLAVLPHTASYTPILGFSGICALLMAGGLWMGRRTRDVA